VLNTQNSLSKEGFMKNSLLLFSMLLTTSIYPFSLPDQDEYQYLNNLALEIGGDKSSFFHNYTEIYASYFAPLRDKPIKMLEIGISTGASVKLWESYFKNAELHFMDLFPENIQYHSTRSRYHIGDQANPHFLSSLIAAVGSGFDIIIDDGGHTMHQQQTSFKHLFPHIKSGGMYIIEDLHTSYWPAFGGDINSPTTTVAFLKSLIDEVNYVGYTTKRASHQNVNPSNTPGLSYYREHIRSMHFYDSVVIIIKR
jgi:hypothetical protein